MTELQVEAPAGDVDRGLASRGALRPATPFASASSARLSCGPSRSGTLAGLDLLPGCGRLLGGGLRCIPVIRFCRGEDVVRAALSSVTSSGGVGSESASVGTASASASTSPPPAVKNSP